MTGLSGSVETWLGLSASTQTKLLISLLAVAVIWLARRLLLRVVYARAKEPAARYQWRKTSATLAFIVALLAIGRVWFEAGGSLVTFFGLVSAGLAIALKDPLSNVAGWVFILWRKPFEVGDRIQIGNVAGDVIDLRVFQFSILEIGNWVDADQSTGRVVHVPNARVFTEAQANYTHAFQYIWNEIPVLVTFESNWRRAKELLLAIAVRFGEPASREAAEQVAQAARKYFIYYTTLTPTVYTSVKDCGVLLTIRHLCDPRKRRGVTHAIWEEILNEFARCPDIDFAYPTTRWFDSRLEGKGDAGHGSTAEGEGPDALTVRDQHE
jgi:small-conductance mechanosensitive channel